ncbi:MAG: lipopolysaccharide heptosyltransferase II [Candidatus Cloacimonas sp.]|nr:lipopolysaccharide heptosyltransferase II [Candidatus Cloacimonas sp.]
MTKRILIVQTAFIGDVILITPLIRAVRQLYPQAIIDVMVVPAAAKLLENNPYINEVLAYPKRKNALVTMLQMLKLLRKKHYDLAISPHSSGRTHILLFLSCIPLRLGFDRGPAPLLLTAKIKHPNNIHKINKNLALLKMLSPRNFEMQSELFPSAQDTAKANELCLGLSDLPLIAIAPGSIWATKCWHIDSYKQLCLQLISRGMAIVLIGGEADKAKCNELQQAALQQNPKAPVLNLAGSTNLLESAAVIAKCRLMICNDSGALHIANAMQTDVFAFFGPTVPAIGYYPYRYGDRVFQVELNCRPCGSHGANKCPLGHHKCMNCISADIIMKAIEETIPISKREGR